MKRTLFVFIFFLPILFSCEDAGYKPDDGSKIRRIRHIWSGKDLLYEYSYNPNGMILEEKSRFHYTFHHYSPSGSLMVSDHYVDERIFSSTSYIADSAWNRKDWVNPGNTDRNSSTAYFYNDKGKLLKSANYLGSIEFEYNEEGRVKSQFFIHEGKRTGWIEYQFDQRGNVWLRKKYDIMEDGEVRPSTSTRYYYDQMKNPWLGASPLPIPGQYTNPNNIIREEYRILFKLDDGMDTFHLTENFYEYDQSGYPVRKNGDISYKYY